ncbi:hypothetical protein ONS95_010804 [Cadophora gregata]|uniref:uncharacterized protein n=2 Tax=Cadophora gregata TaxID=51156 RepID=UPI0026DC61C6|nr:uncharacterized protein ONS95_010804 [Cadophora gregata]KAK0119351.1 hypothetical protein ONS95_010804 [Cadophora gregata]
MISNYFVSTLERRQRQTSKTIPSLLKHQATHHPGFPAVAFSTGSSYQIFIETRCVGLLCTSSIEFLVTWLGLVQAGHSVLLIAPQSPSAINSLCKSCNVSRLYHDVAYSSLAKESGIQALPIPKPGIFKESEVSSNDIAFIHHSSGTSGNPKPIPQTHHGAVGVLPSLNGQNAATFTTTPLYHGGIADCLRAWTSNALIWLFPGDIPITSTTILSCLEIAGRVDPPVRYFSSVPYVLQMLSETPEGLQALQSMELVGVGGAALPESVGNQLVSENVNLVSRFGSAECGFLLSSHRDYPVDKDWQYLRASSRHLFFEQQESGLSELIVLPDWPHMVKRNRPDGSYATSDLFEPHPTLKNAWKYHSRSDAQITLLTGKKFDPAPIEDEIKSTSAVVKDIFIFGNGKQIPGAIVFSDGIQATEALRDEIWKDLQTTNSKQAAHARITQNMFEIICKPYAPLQRSSKGTLLRSHVESRYESNIREMYEPSATKNLGHLLPIENVDSTVRRIISEIVGGDIADDADFFQSGIDSIKAVQIRSRLQEAFGHNCLPWNIVYDCQNVEQLIRYFAEDKAIVGPENPGQDVVMTQLAEKYSRFDVPKAADLAQTGDSSFTVILTGATGGLGAHILNTLQDNPSVNRIVCLVRATGNNEARARVSKSLTERKFPSLYPNSGDKVLCMPVQLDHPNLGLSAEAICNLRNTVTHIIHAAWAVNFSLPLQSFVKEHLAGLQNLISLAASCRNFQHFIFCSSTASVIGQALLENDLLIQEQICTTAPPDGSLGYSKSKWVAEAICSKASALPQMASKISVVRIGQLTGDTRNGVWNRSEAWPLMLSTTKELGCLPRLDEKLSWLPVDSAARAVVDISFLGAASRSDNPCTVYHVINNDRSVSWTDLVRWINKLTEEKISVVDPGIWLAKLEKVDHPARSLLGLWEKSFKKEAPVQSDGSSNTRQVIVFDTKNATNASRSMQDIRPVDEILVGKIWNWLNESD